MNDVGNTNLAGRVSAFFRSASSGGVEATVHAKPVRAAILRSLLAGVALFALGAYFHDAVHKDLPPQAAPIAFAIEAPQPQAGDGLPATGLVRKSEATSSQQVASKNAMAQRLLKGIDVLQDGLPPQERCQVSSMVSSSTHQIDAKIACKGEAGELADSELISIPGTVFFKVGRHAGVDIYTSFSGQAMTANAIGILGLKGTGHKAIYFDESLLNQIGHDFPEVGDRTLVLSFLIETQTAFADQFTEDGLDQVMRADQHAVNQISKDFDIDANGAFDVAESALGSVQRYYAAAGSIGVEKTQPLFEFLQIRLDALDGERQSLLRRQKQEIFT